MSSRKLDGGRYARIDEGEAERPQGYEQESTSLLNYSAARDLDASGPQPSTIARSTVRRRRPESKTSPASFMSLVGLKHFFFTKTMTPVPVARSAPLDYSATSRKPLLQSTDRTSQQLTSQSNPGDIQDALDDPVADDVESQSTDSKTAKANEKKGFRIDARVISDATIGLSDGLTVPFALTAGLSALGNTKVVVYGGFAELIAGAISMGLGGYLAAKSEIASYQAQREETEMLIATNPQTIIQDIAEVFQPYGVPNKIIADLTTHLANSPKLVDFVMHFQHCEEEPASSRAFTSAITIALGYFLGGLLPLIPYFCVDSHQVYEGLYISIAVMVVALFVFGYGKTGVVVGWTGGKKVRACCFGGVQMVIVGGAAAAAAMGLVKLFSHEDGGVEMRK